MGMFDTIKCEYPLPVARAQDQHFQTKDLDCCLNDYRLKLDGSLWVVEYDIEDHSDPNATGLSALMGKLSRVNPRDVPFPHTGRVVFYSDYPVVDPATQAKGRGNVEFAAEFNKGMLVSLEIVEHTPAALEEALEKSARLEQNLPENGGGGGGGGPTRL